MSVACVDVDGPGLRSTVEAVGAAGGEAVAHQGDITDPSVAHSVVSGTVERYGHLDVLANVAGVGHYERIEDESLDAWNRVIGVNLTGTFLMCREAVPALLERRGVIVNVGSVAAMAGHPFGSAYSASKGGIVSLTRTMAAELAPRDVRVNAVCPGGVDTPLLGHFVPPDDADDVLIGRAVPLMGRFLDPDEIARAIEFLASSTMPNLTGAVLVVDGGTVV